ncbi:MAG: hypothetical protein JWM57_1320 [Phycisphaerales bacterium]|nr:hypothetical protein [Phycisphaerales bacterium]
MDKRQLIEAIRQFNPSATIAFLEQFDAPALEQYHARLADTQRRAPQINAWVRPARRDYGALAG